MHPDKVFSPPTLLLFFSFPWISLRNTLLLGGVLLQLNQKGFSGGYCPISKKVGVRASFLRLKRPPGHRIQAPPAAAGLPGLSWNLSLPGRGWSSVRPLTSFLPQEGPLPLFSVNSASLLPHSQETFPSPGSSVRPHSQGLPNLFPKVQSSYTP